MEDKKFDSLQDEENFYKNEIRHYSDLILEEDSAREKIKEYREKLADVNNRIIEKFDTEYELTKERYNAIMAKIEDYTYARNHASQEKREDISKEIKRLNSECYNISSHMDYCSAQSDSRKRQDLRN